MKMMKALIILSFLFSPAVSFCQNIDDLKTELEAQNFIRANFKDNYIDFYVGYIFRSNRGKQYLKKTSGKTWYKTDINQDHLTDLIVTGSVDGKNKALIVLGDTNKKYSVVNLVNRDRGWVRPYVLPTKINDEAVIIFKEIDFTDSDKESDTIEVRKTDTLIYKFKHFINFTPKEKIINRKIASLKYFSESCLGRCPIYDLTIDSTGKARLEAFRYNENIEGVFHCTIPSQTFNYMNTIINYINLPRYSDDYAIYVTDLPTGIIDLTFTDGTHKHIRDYGKEGEFGLVFLYAYFNSLRYSQHWKQ
ncbi:DUF6438 domain-containing protein [Ferruginibacter profundus]